MRALAVLTLTLTGCDATPELTYAQPDEAGAAVVDATNASDANDATTNADDSAPGTDAQPSEEADAPPDTDTGTSPDGGPPPTDGATGCEAGQVPDGATRCCGDTPCVERGGVTCNCTECEQTLKCGAQQRWCCFNDQGAPKCINSGSACN